MIKAFLTALTFIAALSVTPVAARAQETAVRFPVTQVGDTTFTFRVADQPWVRPGLRGIVVDPRQQDLLVARFRVTRISGGQASAVITGQTTSVSTSHSVLLEIPATPWYKQRSFWLGTVVGAAVGFVIGGL